MKNSSYRDPFDPSPKWKKHKSAPQKDPTDVWAHIPKRSKKVANLTRSQQREESSLHKYSSVSVPVISPTETLVIKKLLELPERSQLIAACEHPEGEGFGILLDPLVISIKKFVDEDIDSAHIFFGVRTALGIQITEK